MSKYYNEEIPSLLPCVTLNRDALKWVILEAFSRADGGATWWVILEAFSRDDGGATWWVILEAFSRDEGGAT